MDVPTVDTGPHVLPQADAAPLTPPGVKATLHYVGFTSGPEGRDYRLQVREDALRIDFTVSISHAAFASRRAMLQDGPEICFQRMRQELQACGLQGPRSLTISDRELSDYKATHTTTPRWSSTLPARPKARP
jgi:hypothetical protein